MMAGSDVLAEHERAKKMTAQQEFKAGMRTAPARLYDQAEAVKKAQQAAQAKANAAARTAQQQAQRAAALRRDPLRYDARDPVQYLAMKYGIDQRLLQDPAYAERYGLRPQRIQTGTDAKGKPIFGAGPTTGTTRQKTGEDYVYLGTYDSLVQSQPGAKKLTKQSQDIVVTKKEAKAIIYGWSPQRVAQFQQATGKDITGKLDDKTIREWNDAVDHSAGYYTQTAAKVTPEAYLGIKFGPKNTAEDAEGNLVGAGGTKRGGKSGGSSGGGNGGGTAVTLTNRTELQRVLNSMFEDKLGRKATEQEVTQFLAEINSQETRNPKRVSADGSMVTGGVDPVQVAENHLMKTQGSSVDARTIGVDYYSAVMELIGS
jgi:hypothetical protein